MCFREPSEKVNTAKSQKLIVFQSKSPTLTQTMTTCQGGSRKNWGGKVNTLGLDFWGKSYYILVCEFGFVKVLLLSCVN